MTVSVLLVEDVAELRSVLRQTLRLQGGFEVVGEAADGASAIEAAARHHPDIVVLDLGLPDLAGQELLTRLRAVSPAAQVVVYTGSVSPEEVRTAGEVAAYVSKDRDVADLVGLLAGLSRPRYNTAAVALGPDPRDVGVARRFLFERCREWGCADIVDDAVLVASELVTNALVHAGTRCELRMSATDAALHLQVTDHGGGTPDPVAAADTAEHGRGLLLVSALCVAWGVEALPAGKVVWAQLLRSPETRSSDPAEIAARRRKPASSGKGGPPRGRTAPPGRIDSSHWDSGSRSRTP